MGMIYRRKITPGSSLCCEDKRHGETQECPVCGARFGRAWWIKFYRGGKPFYESSRSSKKGVAELLLKKREGQVADGRFVGINADKLRFEQMATNLENDYKANNRRSLDSIQRVIRRLARFFGNRRAVEITTADVRAFIAQRQAGEKDESGEWIVKPAKPATVQQDLAGLRRMFNLAIQAGELYYRPYVPALKIRNTRKGFLDEAGFLALHEALPAYLKPVVSFAYTFGWRSGEIKAIQWPQVDLVGGTVRLDPGTTKNDDGREVALTPSLHRMLRKQWDMTCALVRRTNPSATPQAVIAAVPWVFHRHGKQITDYRVAWKKACKAAGLAGRIPHDFRRTAVRNMERAGIARSVAMKITGHKTESIYKRYAIVSRGDLRDAALKLEAQTIGGGAEVGCHQDVTVPVKSGPISAHSSQDAEERRCA